MKYLVVIGKRGKRNEFPSTMFEEGFLDAVQLYLEVYEDFEGLNGFDIDDVEGEITDVARMLGYNPDNTNYEIIEK
ncbi:MAG: hypothetical protein ACRC1T_09515 [Clostridium chrysemydis]|uniref:hypothetical protein n=1 Tax=Clostridium chrysemydis TaxID=2665504 RepID=UPI003F40F8BE